jgi:5-methylcytosine-specific restriction protein B
MVLDEDVAQDLQKRYQQLISEGKLLTNEQLSQYYRTFRNKFGPDKLAGLDSEALLDTIYTFGNKDSLFYWLEFKDDDEFPSSSFGSIAGGSAFKYGLFRRKETGIWTSGSSQKPEELTVEQAIEKARKQKDQLIKGTELLERLPAQGTDADYYKLQQNMNMVAPDVSNSAWGHKYFSLLYPEKLDDYHVINYQRFHLLKLLQLPPQGNGLYLSAGQYVAIANKLNLSINNLSTMLNLRDGNPYNYWRIETANEKPRDRWELMRNGNCVAIGWADIGNLASKTNSKAGAVIEEFFQALQFRYPHMAPSDARKAAKQLWHFMDWIAIGDLVMASDGESVIGIGRVTGNYVYDPSSDFPHRRPVEWLSFEEWHQPDVEGILTTVYRMKKDINMLDAEKRIFGKNPMVFAPISDPIPEPASSSSTDTNIVRTAPPKLTGIPARIQSILERKGQVILYGPPGTGKTHWAIMTARELAARANFGTAFSDLNDEQKERITGTDCCPGTVRMCIFHPAYGYEDFLEGFRPEPINGQMHFKARDGIFKRLCKDAQHKPELKFYLIIDEINRGDIPRIFGELLTVLEKDKRDKAIFLPLTNEPFRVPQNVYVIGTMNTADRSIALLDTALRRRFGFIELMPDTRIFGDTVVEGIPLGPWLKALNERICQHAGRDARNLQIGHSYLLEQGRPVGDFTTFARIVQEDILPLLEEYCYEDYSRLESILGTGLVDIQNQQFRNEMFDSLNRGKLIQALLAPSPDITASTQALASDAEVAEEIQDEEENDATKLENNA